ncbi:hypothetical protein BIY21_18360 [Vibrio ponticus]|uniref:DUF2057 domain-containing protein n=2 Tax=Vibrio ponticus TaxID=265668 RepID=A0ABX3FA56_9VIBR|nr:hypothetical protein BIY21_18360 [Vibrio ponticus]
MAGVLAFPLQAAVLSAQDGVSILYINGEKAEQRIGENQIEEGFVQALVRFDDKLGVGNSAKVYTSKPFFLNFDAKGSEIEIFAPKVYSEIEADKEFEKANPGWKVLVDGKEVQFEQAVLKGKGGFMPYAGMENLVAEHNKQRGIYFNNGELVDAPVAAELAPVAVVTTSAVATANSTANNAAKATSQAPKAAVKNVEQLKAWYLKASTEERKEFRRWMIDQE